MKAVPTGHTPLIRGSPNHTPPNHTPLIRSPPNHTPLIRSPPNHPQVQTLQARVDAETKAKEAALRLASEQVLCM